MIFAPNAFLPNFGLETFETNIRDLLDAYYVGDLSKKVPKLTDIVTFGLVCTVHVDAKIIRARKAGKGTNHVKIGPVYYKFPMAAELCEHVAKTL